MPSPRHFPGLHVKRWFSTRGRRLLAVYLVLLAASHLWRLRQPDEGRPAVGQQFAVLPAVDTRGPEAHGEIRLAYRDLSPRPGSDREVVVLLHGTPMAGASFNGLAPVLAEAHRVVVPDLPGFGGSTRRIPDYSMRAHAEYLRELLDSLSIRHAHIVAYSQGGGVALEFERVAPSRMKSLTLLSSIGVQELELLGDYLPNHAVYRIQWLGLALIQEGFPHFGWMDDALLNVPYARNFSDSDQRPMRGILETLEIPTLILHGRTDRLVPLAAAQEHYRLVPQSEWVLFEGGHGILFSQSRTLGGEILSFVDRVTSGRAVTRGNADLERVAAAVRPFDWSAVPPVEGISLVLLLALLCFATWITEDITCIVGGMMVARGVIGYLPATLACLVGIYTGDLLLYLAGRCLGAPLLARAPLRFWIAPETLDRSREWFQRRGPIVLIASRFLPGTRLGTYVTAGLLKTPFTTFSLYFLVAAILWTPLLVGVASLVGSAAISFLETYQVYSLPAALLLGVLMWIAVKILVPCFSFEGRRLLVGRWRRIRHWEFWPMWAFYPPIALYVLVLGIRHRGLTTFTAANPAMPAGGFIGESKGAILKALDPRQRWIAKTELLPDSAPIEERAAAVDAFMERHGLTYPIVLKPDAGQRGEGVRIVRAAAEVREELARAPWSMLVQEFVPGPEYGVFYARRPGQAKGFIFAVTEKEFPSVRGDGRSTLEHLILADERAVCMARRHLAVHADRLADVPAEGEVVPLVELGTHCLGAVFRDGGRLVTPALEAAIEAISRPYEGFNFGRYDIRTESAEALQAGRDFKVIELNGVTSEATNIYDPDHSVFTAWRILARQWALAFEIGAANRARGAKVAGLGELLREARGYVHKPASTRLGSCTG